MRPQHEWWNPGGILGRDVGVREWRGGIVDTPNGPRVELKRPDGSTALGYLDPSRDADLNPAGANESWQKNQQRKSEDKLIARADARSAKNDQRYDQHRADTLASLERQGAQFNAQHGLAVANSDRNFQTALEQIRSTQQQNQATNTLALKQLEEGVAARRDSTDLARQAQALTAQVQAQTLGLKASELEMNAGFRDRELKSEEERWKAQVADARGSRKLQFIAQAAQALLA